MKKSRQYLVVGLGRFGSALALALAEQGMQVLAIDRNLEIVEAHRSKLTDVVRGDAMDASVLKQLGVADFDAAVVTMGDDVKASSVIVMHLKELGVPYVIAKASDDFHGRMLTRLGADKVIFPERDMGQRIAHNLVSEKIMDFIELSPDYSLMEMRPRRGYAPRAGRRDAGGEPGGGSLKSEGRFGWRKFAVCSGSTAAPARRRAGRGAGGAWC